MGIPTIRSPFFFGYRKRKGMPLEYSPKKHGDHHRPLGCYHQQLDPAYPLCLRAIAATEDMVAGSPLTIFVPHAVEALLNPRHTQHLLVSHLTSYEILLLMLFTQLFCTVITLIQPFFSLLRPIKPLIIAWHWQIISWVCVMVCRKLLWVKLFSYGLQVVRVLEIKIENTVMIMQLKSLRHFYLWLLQPSRPNCMLSPRPAFQPRAKVPAFLLESICFWSSSWLWKVMEIMWLAYFQWK